MIIVDQLEEKAFFIESDTCVCIIENDDGREYFNGEFGGYSDVFPYSVAIRRKSGRRFDILGVYVDHDTAKDAFKSFIKMLGEKVIYF